MLRRPGFARPPYLLSRPEMTMRMRIDMQKNERVTSGEGKRTKGNVSCQEYKWESIFIVATCDTDLASPTYDFLT